MFTYEELVGFMGSPASDVEIMAATIFWALAVMWGIRKLVKFINRS